MDQNENTKTEKISGDDKSSSTKTSPVQTSTGKDNIAVFQGQYYVDLNRELPEFSTEEVKAYSTGTSRAKPEGFFTLICNPRYTSRTNVVKHYQQFANESLAKLATYGRLIFPDGTARYCYVYQDNLIKRAYQTNDDLALGWKTEHILEKLLIPIVMALKNLQSRDVVHGNIRATNLYTGGSKKIDKFKLGDCLSAPASFNQPTVYEPIERAMADPIGRGEGTIKDDLYSLGVLLAQHVRNFDPLRGKTGDEIIASKVVHGSYSALIGSSDRVSSGITDLIRGLLTDVEKNRWSLDEVMEWLDGRRQNIKQNVKTKKSARSIHFDGTDFFYARTLAYRLMKKPQDAVHLIESNELHHWIERSLSNKEMLERIESATQSASEGGVGVGYWDKLLPRISVALDPYAPIRFRNLSLHMNSIGNVMVDSYVQKKGMNNFIELFSNGIIHYWITVCADLNMDVSGELKQFETVRSFFRHKNIVSGIERCLYFLNPSIHCLSPLVADYFATDPKEYLMALEVEAERANGNYPEKIIDQQAACFLISRDARLIEPYIYDLSSDEKFRYIIANLKILSAIQKYYDAPAIPHLTAWFCNILDPLIMRYHDNEIHDKIKKDILKKRDGGSLEDIVAIIDNPQKIKKDQIAYRQALIQYRQLNNELTTLKQKLNKPKFFAERTGREWAATISGVISTLIILGFIMVHYGGGVQ